MIKFVYFDIGGVAILDFSKTDKWKKMKKVMGVKPEFEEEYDKLYDEYEHKELCLTRHVDTLMPVFSEKFGMKYPKNFLMSEFFIDNFNRNTSLWPVIDEIRKSCSIGLLTNMYVGMLDDIEKAKLLPPVKWDVVIDSTKELVQKPDPEIFTLSEKKCGFRGNQILFVDNSQKNIDTAQKFGWLTFLYDPEYPAKSSRDLLQFFADKQGE